MLRSYEYVNLADIIASERSAGGVGRRHFFHDLRLLDPRIDSVERSFYFKMERARASSQGPD